ncbi:hypothetical protein TNIN_429961 [Trichonephila inaurata madagascariensis]|uniref:Uncharacterized protein n=1 Tax=Trichonephila inaurata madagascariensis TaxID=2747483 RepID=A0A8X6WXZ1_9ARAC|nr:hypothetical protein TNIN_429961 [Trichonephila inaurata madagascariensis]
MQYIKIIVFLWFAYSSNCHINDKDSNKNLLTKRFENLEQSSIPYSNFLKDNERRDIDDKNLFREQSKTSYLLPEYILKKLQILRKNDYRPKSTIGYILKSNIQPEVLSEIKNLPSESPTLLRNRKGNKRAVVNQLKKAVNHSDPDENRRNQYPVLKKSYEKTNKKVKFKDLNFQMTISASDFITEHAEVESKESTPTVKNKKSILLKKVKNKNSQIPTLSHSKNLKIDAFTELITEASSSVDIAKALLKNKETMVAAKTKPNVYGFKNKGDTKNLEIDTFTELITEASSSLDIAKALLKNKETMVAARTKPNVYGFKNKGGTKNLEIDTFSELMTKASSLVDDAKTLLKNKETKVAARTKPNVYGLKNKEGTKNLEIDTFTELIPEANPLIGNTKTFVKNRESKAPAKTKPSEYGLKNIGGATTVKSQEMESAIERTEIEYRSESPVTMFILEIIGDTSASIGDTSASIESESVETGNSTDPRSSTESFTTQEYMNDYGIPENGLQKFLSVSGETKPTQPNTAVRTTSEE